jgi:hypothetical protein
MLECSPQTLDFALSSFCNLAVKNGADARHDGQVRLINIMYNLEKQKQNIGIYLLEETLRCTQ